MFCFISKLLRSWSECLRDGPSLPTIEFCYIESNSLTAFSKNWSGNSRGKLKRKWLFLIFVLWWHLPKCSKMSDSFLKRFVYFTLSELFRLLSERQQTFYYILGRCYHWLKIKNSCFLLNVPPELQNQFLEKAIEIDFVQQKLIVPFKLYQKSPSVEMTSVIRI